MEIMGAVGKWHLAAHIRECFPKFTLNFVEGAGQVEGEILETLWSRMDEIAGLAQAMSIAHHQETVDEHMNDNNWRKIIRISRALYFMCDTVDLTQDIADSLCGKYFRAKQGFAETKLVFDGLTARLDAPLVQEWTAQERMAMEQRGDSLKIYEVASEKGMKIFCSSD